jgi:hypothetical protein
VYVCLYVCLFVCLYDFMFFFVIKFFSFFFSFSPTTRILHKAVKGADHPTPFAMGTTVGDTTSGGMFFANQAAATTAGGSGYAAQKVEEDEPENEFMPGPEGWKAGRVLIGDMHLTAELNANAAHTDQAAQDPARRNFYDTPQGRSSSATATSASATAFAAEVAAAASAHAAASAAVTEAYGRRTFSERDLALDFDAREEWAGARPGFVFRLGAKGQGYYRDVLPAPVPVSASASASEPEPAI